ncbi:hypothetical protein CTheo_8105 [Ceratobasidium theobromae]|uniref:Uncharacterized protein n=1 Tax=Ceratobasidium theobromae TaxID=1582974 RepID=A0A5N5Q9P4_9AGAM|nr:hypothetical protein CTheo_8105 [Ceratobasidium theobromae]
MVRILLHPPLDINLDMIHQHTASLIRLFAQQMSAHAQIPRHVHPALPTARPVSGLTYIRRHFYAPEVLPLVGVLTFAVSMGVYFSTSAARKNDVQWLPRTQPWIHTPTERAHWDGAGGVRETLQKEYQQKAKSILQEQGHIFWLEAGVPKNAITARVASIRSTSEVLRAGTPNFSTSRRAALIPANAAIIDKSSTKVREIESAGSQLAIPWKIAMWSNFGLPSSTQLDAPLVLADVIAFVLEESDATYEELESAGITPSLGAPCAASDTFDHAISTRVVDLDSSVPAFRMNRELAGLDAAWTDFGITPISEAPQPLDRDLFGSFKHGGGTQASEIPNTH